MAEFISFLCKVLLLLSSECIHDLRVNSNMNSSQAYVNRCRVDEGWTFVRNTTLKTKKKKKNTEMTVINEELSCFIYLTLANNTGASALIIRTSSSDFMI